MTTFPHELRYLNQLHRKLSPVIGGTMLMTVLLAVSAASLSQPATQQPVAGGELSRRLAAGEPYVLLTRRDIFPLASRGNDDWFVFTGYYVPVNGTWTSSATGFPSPGTPWHSCPAATQCGGIHERGFVLDRWYRPEQHEIVVVGQKLTFDEQGRVFHEGRQIGLIFSGSFAREAAAATTRRPPTPIVPVFAPATEEERRWGPIVRLIGKDWQVSPTTILRWDWDAARQRIVQTAIENGRTTQNMSMSLIHNRVIEVRLRNSTGRDAIYMLQLEADGGYLFVLPGIDPSRRWVYHIEADRYRLVEHSLRDFSTPEVILQTGTVRGGDPRR